MVYNVSILVLSIPCTLLIGGSLVGISSIYTDGLITNQHIYLLAFSLLYFLIHYFALLLGLKQKRLNTKTVKYLCITDALSFGYSFLSALVSLKHTLKDFICFVKGEHLALDHQINLVFNSIVFLAVMLRIVFIIIFAIRSKRSTEDSSEGQRDGLREP